MWTITDWVLKKYGQDYFVHVKSFVLEQATMTTKVKSKSQCAQALLHWSANRACDRR
jgi:hypothetical protein